MLELAGGTVKCEVKRRAPDEIFEVRSAGNRVRVVGTIFTVTRTAGGITSVEVVRGRVSVIDRAGKRSLVSTGSQWRTPRSQPVTKDAAEPPAPGATVHPVRTAAADPAPKRTHRRRKARRTKPAKATGPALAPAKVATTKTAAIKAAPLKPATTKAAPVGPPPAAHRLKVIKIQVPDSTMTPPKPPATLENSLRQRLVKVVKTIRAGNCSRALSTMRRISRSLRSRSHPTDLLYLMGYCLHRQGKKRATALFRAYRRLTRSRRWVVPTSPGQKLPLPRISQLRN